MNNALGADLTIVFPKGPNQTSLARPFPGYPGLSAEVSAAFFRLPLHPSSFKERDEINIFSHFDDEVISTELFTA